MSDDNLEEPKKHSNIPVRVPRCTGTAKRTGKQCMMPAIPGGTVCRKHGGSAPQVKAAANRRRLLEEAHADIELWGGRKDIHPAAISGPGDVRVDLPGTTGTVHKVTLVSTTSMGPVSLTLPNS